MNQNRAPLLEWGQSPDPRAIFYMPGHQRSGNVDPGLRTWLGDGPFQADIPELPGVDGAIAAAEALAAEAFGAERTWLLTNGATGALQAAILATVNPEDVVLVGRNQHRAAIAGLILSGARPVYLPTAHRDGVDLGVTPEALAQGLAAHPTAKAVLLVSPNYYGIVVDVGACCRLAHGRGVPVIVDAAHGSHLRFHPALPEDALTAGADVVVHSLHKTGTALSQGALLHHQGKRVDGDRLAQAVAWLHSTSPNFALLASLDGARRQLVSVGESHLSRILAGTADLRQTVDRLEGLATLHPASVLGLDATRFTLLTAGLGRTGFAIDEILQNLGIVAEWPGWGHLTFVLTIATPDPAIARLQQTLPELVAHRRPQPLPQLPPPPI
ncbi:MAG: aminotransferase class I/II-fold pyridoxal phosphate-dependent enzyme, partial [Oscillatoriales cyanobacterium SM2_1_8]|nr:aminotransferase class I/II-fold pyridoxal phosphate-dependent enzyme [Oscillatoriales cyanobacterium SM2_1_8]